MLFSAQSESQIRTVTNLLDQTESLEISHSVLIYTGNGI